MAQTAEEVFAKLSDEGGRQARDILLRLVEPSDGGGVICQRVDRASVAVDDAHARVADRLVDARLVTSDEESFQLAHEAVAREWPRLREWLADDVEGQRIMRHLNAAAHAWEAMGRPDSELYRGPRLSAAKHWRRTASPVLAPVEAASSMPPSSARPRTSMRHGVNWRRSGALCGACAGWPARPPRSPCSRSRRDPSRRSRSPRRTRQAVIDDARRVAALAVAEPVYERALLHGDGGIRLWDAPPTRRALLDVMGRSPRIVRRDAHERRRGHPADVARPRQFERRHRGHERSKSGSSISIERAQVAAITYERDLVLDAVEAPDRRIALSVLEDCMRPK